MNRTDDKSLVIFGEDVSKLPCFRNSLLYGILGGIGCGLARFMFTSRPKSGADFAVGSFSFITLVYWFRCQYNYSKAKQEILQVQTLLEQHLQNEGHESATGSSVEPANI